MLKKLTIVLLIIKYFSLNLIAQDPKILWRFDTKSFAAGQAACDDLDGDGNYEIAFGCYRNDGALYVLNSEDGSLLWKYLPHNPGFEGCNDVALLIYDVVGDKNKEVIMASSCTPVTTCLNGKTGEVIWQAQTGGSDSPPTIADIDNDGNMEILHGEFLGWVRCLDAKTGKLKWRMQVNNNSWIQTAPSIVDLNNDKVLDFVVGTWHFNKEDSLYAFDGKTQKRLWAIPVHDYIYHGTSVADLDNDKKPELLFGSYNSKVYCINGEDGTIAWTYEGLSAVACPITIGDIDNDGKCDILFTSWFEAIALNDDGSVKWKYNMPDNSFSFRGITLADVNNDPYLDCIFGTYSGKLIAVNGKNGSEITYVDLLADYGKSPFDINHQPLIADFNKDGILDAFVVGGYGVASPTILNNYGRAYMVSLGKGNGPEWKMFQHDVRRHSTLCNSVLTKVNTISDSDILLQPNPSSKFIELKLPEEQYFKGKFEVTNLLGENCTSSISMEKTNFTRSIKLDISKLVPGVYLINTNQGVIKFIKI